MALLVNWHGLNKVTNIVPPSQLAGIVPGPALHHLHKAASVALPYQLKAVSQATACLLEHW